MNKTNDRISPDVIAVDIEKLSAILSCGCATARKIGEQAEARIFIGRRVIYPYKQYESEIIDGVIEGLITCDTVGFEDYPCELTMIRWKTQNIQLPL